MSGFYGECADHGFPEYVNIPGMGRKSAAEIDAMPAAVRRIAADALRSMANA